MIKSLTFTNTSSKMLPTAGAAVPALRLKWIISTNGLVTPLDFQRQIIEMKHLRDYARGKQHLAWQ